VRQTGDGDIGVNTEVFAAACVVITPVARIQRHQLEQSTGCGRNALLQEFEVLDIRRQVAHAYRNDHMVVAVHRQWQL